MNHPLTVWRKRQKPPVTKTEFATRIGKKWKAVHRVERFDVLPSYTLAKSIEAATSGAVTVEALIDKCRSRVVQARRERVTKASTEAA